MAPGCVAVVDTAAAVQARAKTVAAVMDTAGCVAAAAVLDEEVAGHANDADALAMPSPTPWCVLTLEDDDDEEEEDEASVFPLDLVWGKHRRWGKCESVHHSADRHVFVDWCPVVALVDDKEGDDHGGATTTNKRTRTF